MKEKEQKKNRKEWWILVNLNIVCIDQRVNGR